MREKKFDFIHLGELFTLEFGTFSQLICDLLKPNSGDVEFLISPLTGQSIPASKMAEHMKVGLLDPSWVEQRKSEIAKKKDEEDYYAADEGVVDTLNRIAKRRTDIFGVEERGIGRTIDDDQKKVAQEIGWDGHKRTAGNAMAAQMHSDSEKAKERMDMLNRGIMPDDLKDRVRNPIVAQSQYYNVELNCDWTFQTMRAKDFELCSRTRAWARPVPRRSLKCPNRAHRRRRE